MASLISFGHDQLCFGSDDFHTSRKAHTINRFGSIDISGTTGPQDTSCGIRWPLAGKAA